MPMNYRSNHLYICLFKLLTQMQVIRSMQEAINFSFLIFRKYYNNYLNHLKKESKYSTEKFSSYSGNRSNTRANSYLKTPNSITFDYAFNCI